MKWSGWARVLVLVLLGASEASAQQLPFTWDIPKVVSTVDVPGVMMADGIPVQIHAVRSAEKPEVLLQHIVDRFESWGFFIPPIETQAQPFREPQITALDSERLISYTAIFQPNPDGTTTVYLGEASLSRPPETPSPFAPVFPGAQGLVHSDVEAARSLTYAVSAKAPEVEAFYRKELAKVGYTEVDKGLYRNGSDELQVLLRPLKSGQLSVMVIRRTAAPETLPTPEQEP